MNVQTICLAILQLGDATGYEIRKSVSEGPFSHFVEASYGAIYPALNKLEAEGLVSVRVEEQDGKPNRRVFTITEAGRQAVFADLSQPLRADTFRSEFMFLAMFAEYLPRKTMRAAFDMQVERLNAELQAIDAATCAQGPASGAWVAECGRICLQAQLDYLSENRDTLLALSRNAPAASPSDDAAFLAAE